LKPDAPPLPLATLSDFGDWLNPMLVKELRQGLKTNLFVGVFVLVQLAMVVLIGFRLLSAGTEDASETGEGLDAVLWVALGAAMLLVMPMRGLHSISEETKQNTLDLVQLTHLGALRIVLGKWIALVGQILLLAAAVLPYAVLRYFFGGVDVVSNLGGMLSLLLSSMVMSAGCIMLSTAPVITRSLLIGFLFFGISSSGFGLMVGGVIGFPGSTGMTSSLLGPLVAAVAATSFLLGLAASRIASAAENFAVVLRGIALITAASALIAVGILGIRSDLWIVAAWVIGAWSIFEALTERTNELPSLYAPWVRHGRLGRLLGRIFYPGWATGLVYTAVLLAVLVALAALMTAPTDQDHVWIVSLLCYLAVIFPLPVVILLRQTGRIKQLGGLYLLLQGFCFLLFALARMLSSFRGSDDALVSVIDALTPTTALLSTVTGWVARSSDVHWATVPLISLSGGGIVFLWLIHRSRREFKLIRQLEARVLPSPNAEPQA